MTLQHSVSTPSAPMKGSSEKWLIPTQEQGKVQYEPRIYFCGARKAGNAQRMTGAWLKDTGVSLSHFWSIEKQLNNKINENSRL